MIIPSKGISGSENEGTVAIFCGNIPLHRPYIDLIYGRYLQFRNLSHGHWYHDFWCFIPSATPPPRPEPASAREAEVRLEARPAPWNLIRNWDILRSPGESGAMLQIILVFLAWPGVCILKLYFRDEWDDIIISHHINSYNTMRSYIPRQLEWWDMTCCLFELAFLSATQRVLILAAIVCPSLRWHFSGPVAGKWSGCSDCEDENFNSEFAAAKPFPSGCK